MGVGTGASGFVMTAGGSAAGNCGTGSGIAGGATVGSGATDSTTGNCGTGSGVAGGATVGNSGSGSGSGAVGAGVPERRDFMDEFDGGFGLGELSGAQALEKFPGPHTSIAAPAGGAAAK